MIDRTHRKRIEPALRVLGALALLLTMALGAAAPGAAAAVELSSVDIGAHTCDGPQSCWNEIGARFTVTTLDGAFIGSCTLEGERAIYYPMGCQVDIPTGSTVVITEDVGTITPGYAPVENPMIFEAWVPTVASFNGVIFQNMSQSAGASTGQTSDVAIATTESGRTVTDACYVLVGYSNVGCDENGDGLVTFQDIPLGSYTVRQTADLGPGRAVPDFTVQVRGNAGPGGWEVFPATIVSASGGPVTQPGGATDISLITRDPATGDLLTDTCYVLVGYSNEGCDENGDGQVTFDAIPFGTWTVRQTLVPAGYPAVRDFEIEVLPTTYPTGFVVRQAAQPNAPNTRNVSVMLIDVATDTKVPGGGCVQIVNASNVGCDEDLIDGQVDFLDVPAGDHDIVVTNLPAGCTVANPGDLEIRIDARTDPANLFVYVYIQRGGV